jgi:hypothetical protein
MVAELAGARKYNVIPGERFGYWWYFADAAPGPDPALVYHRWDGRFVIAMPADGDLYQVIVLPDMRFLPDFRQDRESGRKDVRGPEVRVFLSRVRGPGLGFGR